MKFRSIQSSANNDDNTSVKDVKVTTVEGKSYRMKKENGKLVLLEIEGEKVPEERFGEYAGLVENLEASIAEARQRKAEQVQLNKERREANQARAARTAEQKRRVKEANKQRQENNAKRQEVNRKRAEEKAQRVDDNKARIREDVKRKQEISKRKIENSRRNSELKKKQIENNKKKTIMLPAIISVHFKPLFIVLILFIKSI